ncbi:MAG: O-antigen ligase family protein [Chloracidobacterium sp.]|nr:O-antigen ligase family protein [Chloracidobacterium sp.]
MKNHPPSIDLRSQYPSAFVVTSAALAIILLSALFSTPRPQAIANQPWKVELLIGIFAIPFFVWVYKKTHGTYISLERSNFRFAVICSLLFIVWSGVSAAWAPLPLTALFQTLVWAIYAAIFSAFLQLLRANAGIKVILATFSIACGILGLLAIVDFASITDFLIAQGIIRVRYAKFAELALTAAPLICIASIYARRRIASITTAIIWMLAWLAVMLSLSKGAFVAGIAAHFILFGGSILFSHKAFRRKVLVRATIWLVFTIVVQVAFSAFSTIPSTADYISGKADKTRDTSMFRVYVWQVGMKMAADHWFLGVGSGNFGVAFNDSRTTFAAARPDDRTPEYGQDYMFERAHNEVLQIFAELGIVGIMLFAAVFGSFIFLAVKVFIRKEFKLSPMLWAAIAGVSGFAISSMVSSFSFRATQNGVVFVMVMAVGVYELTKSCTKSITASPTIKPSKIMFISSLTAAVILIVFAAPKAVAEYYLYQAERAADNTAAAELFRTAIRLDPDNASAYYYFANRSNFDSDNETAAKMLRIGIDRGIGVTVTYSQLAKFELLSGDAIAAEKTLADAVRIFPNSVFMRVRFATFMCDQRKQAEADREMEFARSIDAGQANGWQILIQKGSTAAFYAAKQDANIDPPAELIPENAVYEYIDKPPLN